VFLFFIFTLLYLVKMSLNPQSIRALHSAGQNACKTVLYGWGQTQALPLTKGHINRVFNQPTCLKLEADYALPVSEVLYFI
jgi:hypothetical protein